MALQNEAFHVNCVRLASADEQNAPQESLHSCTRGAFWQARPVGPQMESTNLKD